MHWFDAVFGVLAVVGLVWGWMRGLWMALAGGVAFILAFWLAYRYLFLAEGVLKDYLFNSTALQVVAFISMYLLCLLGMYIVALVVKKIVHATPLGLADRLGGALMGLVKVIILASLVWYLSSLTGMQKYFDGSKTADYIIILTAHKI